MSRNDARGWIKRLRPMLMWNITQRRVVKFYRLLEQRIGPIFKGQDVQEETSVKDYHSTLRNIPEERRCHQYRGGRLKSRLNKGVFRRVRTITKSDYYLRHVCPSVLPSVSPHWTTRPLLGEFSRNLMFEYPLKIRRDSSSFIKIWQE
jgi:hypothetical protein